MHKAKLLCWTIVGFLACPAITWCDAQTATHGLPENPNCSDKSADTIGTATQEADGTIVLRLRTMETSGRLGEGQLRYGPYNPQYPMIAKHVGPIPPGTSVFVRPFDTDNECR